MIALCESPRVERTDANFIRTFTGRKFWPLDPRAEEICIEDVAHHLSLENRFTGATYCPYSVADHSLRVSKVAEQAILRKSRNFVHAREVALWGLLHDASEAYLKDLPAPIKHSAGLGEFYSQIERLVMGEVIARFDLIPHEPAIVKEADIILLNTEKRDLMCGSRFSPQVLPDTIFPMSPGEAEAEFLRRFNLLSMARQAERAALNF